MYIQTRQTNLVYVWTPRFRTAYRLLREQYNFSMREAIRYGWWLAHGNKRLYPGEMRAWIKRQIMEYPIATGLLMVVWADAILIFVWWTITR